MYIQTNDGVKFCEQSESISELAKALVAAQAVMGGAVKDTNNTFFKSKYATLEAVWDACRVPLSSNGLSVVQTTSQSDGDSVLVNTTLLHVSGQWISGQLKMRPVKNDPQGIGSCITYARRYALAAMVGVFQTDDDGNEASGVKAPATEAPAPRYISDKPSAKSSNWEQLPGCITEGQSRLIYARRKKAGKVSDQQFPAVLEEMGIDSENAIPKAKLDAVLAAVE